MKKKVVNKPTTLSTIKLVSQKPNSSTQSIERKKKKKQKPCDRNIEESGKMEDESVKKRLLITEENKLKLEELKKKSYGVSEDGNSLTMKIQIGDMKNLEIPKPDPDLCDEDDEQESFPTRLPQIVPWNKKLDVSETGLAIRGGSFINLCQGISRRIRAEKSSHKKKPNDARGHASKPQFRGSSRNDANSVPVETETYETTSKKGHGSQRQFKNNSRGQNNANFVPLATAKRKNQQMFDNAKSNEESNLHPSWQAKKKLASKLSDINSFQGKRIVFD